MRRLLSDRPGSRGSAIGLSSCEIAVALERAREMLAHGAARLGRILRRDAGNDAAMLVLDALEIGAALGRRVGAEPHALARNDVAAEELEEARELAVAGGDGDGAVKGEILWHRALAAPQRLVDGAPGGADVGDLPARLFLGGERRRLDLDRQPQL